MHVVRVLGGGGVSVCQGCGGPLPTKARKWCSERCRTHTLYSGVCVDCGAPTYSGTVPPSKRCKPCSALADTERKRAAAAPFRAEAEAAWAEGLTIREMCLRFGWKYSKISVLRARGYNLPHRRTPEQLARINAAKARAARRSAA